MMSKNLFRRKRTCQYFFLFSDVNESFSWPVYRNVIISLTCKVVKAASTLILYTKTPTEFVENLTLPFSSVKRSRRTTIVRPDDDPKKGILRILEKIIEGATSTHGGIRFLHQFTAIFPNSVPPTGFDYILARSQNFDQIYQRHVI